MNALIFAAGLGTRLRPLTDTMPKALVAVGGQPLLWHAIGRLKAAGATEIVVNVHHFAEQIADYLSRHDFGLPVRVSWEREQLLDTGGGLRQALTLFSRPDKPVLIHNVDILSNASLHDFYTANQAADAALLVSERATTRYLLFDADNRLCGWTNTQTGEVRSPHPGLDPGRCKAYAFSGIHVFSPRLFALRSNLPARFSIVDFYLSVCAEARIVACPQADLQLLDVGKTGALAQAEAFLSAGQ